MVNLTKDDLLEPIIEGGEKLYRLRPLAAADVATEAYMNYSAMPDFVKVMRALPIIGSNFFSFQYAIAAKTAKTAISNPAVFNKVGYMLSEFSGARSPQEKAALEEKYNEYLKSPTVVNIMGAMNTDLKGLIPWYTMNMFNPSEKTYTDTPQGNALKILDQIPVFQTPVGQVLKDYWIQPMILSGTGQAPQGQFGQPLYPSFDVNGKPIEAGLGTKAFYGARTYAESFVPGALGYLGFLNAFAGLSPEVIEYLPSYRGRTAAEATQGRTSIGKIAKEDAFRRSLRAAVGMAGLPLYPLNVTTTSSN
jgi:hypothetical protein